MQNSSNVGTIKLALRLGDERLKSYIDRYGFGQKTLVDLPAEVRGMVRDTSEWTKTSIGSIAIGQEISVTPLQIASHGFDHRQRGHSLSPLCRAENSGPERRNN